MVRPGGTLVTGPLGARPAGGRGARDGRAQGAARARGRDFQRHTSEDSLTIETPRGTYPGIELRALGRFQRDELRRWRSPPPRPSSTGRSTPMRFAAPRASSSCRDGSRSSRRALAWCSTAPTTRAARGRWRSRFPRSWASGPLIAVALDPRGQGRGRDPREPPAAVRRRRLHAVLAAPARCRRRCSRACGASSAAAGERSSPTPRRRVASARSRAGAGGAVVVTGSIYLLAELVDRPATLGGREAHPRAAR